MEKFDSISHFIQSGNFHYRVFDMGRKVTVIENQLFKKLEDQEMAYPYPFQQKAWLALLLWEDKKQDESVIWFLKFPIDELGFLKQESRDAFLIELLEQAGKNILAKQKDKQVLDELKESPFAFKPAEFRLAAFHALATRELGQTASKYYQHARQYLTGESGFDQWQFLGLQGIADVVARLDQSDLNNEVSNEELLANAVKEMPAQPLESFSQMLENTVISKPLFDVLRDRLQQELANESPNVLLVSALLRGVSGATIEQKKDVFKLALESSLGKQIEVLAAISGRSWESLKALDLLVIFMDRLAQHEQASFNAIVTDLLMIPGMREPIFSVMRSPDRSPQVSKKLGEFMAMITAVK